MKSGSQFGRVFIVSKVSTVLLMYTYNALLVLLKNLTGSILNNFEHCNISVRNWGLQQQTK